MKQVTLKPEMEVGGEPAGPWSIREFKNGIPVAGEPQPYRRVCECEKAKPEDPDAPQSVCTECDGRTVSWITFSEAEEKARLLGAQVVIV